MELILLIIVGSVIAGGLTFYGLHTLVLRYRLRALARPTPAATAFSDLCQALEKGDRKQIQAELAALGHYVVFHEEAGNTEPLKALPPPQQLNDGLVLYPYAFASLCAEHFNSAEDLLAALEVAAKQYGTVAFKEDPDDRYELSLEYNAAKKAFNCMYAGGDSETREWLTRDEPLALLGRFIVDTDDEEHAPLDNDLVT